MRSKDHTKEFLLSLDGLTYFYETGHWWKVECQEIPETPERPDGLKYAMSFFGPDDRCLVRFDNSHAVRVKGRPNPVAFDHWHRFSNPEELVPYQFRNAEALIIDFYEAVDRHLPPELRSS